MLWKFHHAWCYGNCSSRVVAMEISRHLAMKLLHKKFSVKWTSDRFSLFIIVKSYNIVAAHLTRGKWKLLITCELKIAKKSRVRFAHLWFFLPFLFTRDEQFPFSTCEVRSNTICTAKQIDLRVRSSEGTFSKLLWLEHEQTHELCLDFLYSESTRSIRIRGFSNLPGTSNKSRVYNGSIACDCSLHFSQCKYCIWDTARN